MWAYTKVFNMWSACPGRQIFVDLIFDPIFGQVSFNVLWYFATVLIIFEDRTTWGRRLDQKSQLVWSKVPFTNLLYLYWAFPPFFNGYARISILVHLLVVHCWCFGHNSAPWGAFYMIFGGNDPTGLPDLSKNSRTARNLHRNLQKQKKTNLTTMKIRVHFYSGS